MGWLGYIVTGQPMRLSCLSSVPYALFIFTNNVSFLARALLIEIPYSFHTLDTLDHSTLAAFSFHSMSK
jgi:hypothetical protein